MATGATTSTNVKRIVAAFELARLRREMEHRHQRMEELFTTTSVVSATPTATPSASLSSPAFSTMPSAPTPTASASIDNTPLTSTTTKEPLQNPPARCSTPGRSHDKHALVLGTAALAPLQDAHKHAQPLQEDMTAMASKAPPTEFHAQVVFDEMHQRKVHSQLCVHSALLQAVS
ncbi:unnamed protein product [Urochloa humidicola]